LIIESKGSEKSQHDALLGDFYTSLHVGMQDSPFMPEPQIKQTDA